MPQSLGAVSEGEKRNRGGGISGMENERGSNGAHGAAGVGRRWQQRRHERLGMCLPKKGAKRSDSEGRVSLIVGRRIDTHTACPSAKRAIEHPNNDTPKDTSAMFS